MIQRRQRRRRQHKTNYHKQKGGFLSRNGFAFAGINTINQVGKIASALIKNARLEIINNKLMKP